MRTFLIFLLFLAITGGIWLFQKYDMGQLKGLDSYTDSKRLALIIGNGKYKNIPSLRNPINDAKDMAAALKNLGYEVILKTDASRQAMIEAMQDFGAKLQKQGGVGLFYFSGHGLQVQGINYLIPSDADIKSEADVEFATVELDRVMAQMKRAKNQLNLVFLDACRDNPYDTRIKGLKKGLAGIKGPTGTLIAFATAPDAPSWGGKPGERNSVYTKYLLEGLRDKSHWRLTDLLIAMRNQVMAETQNEPVQQVPWESGSLTGKFCFGTCGDEGQRADLEQQLAELEQQRAEINRQRAQLEQQQLEQDQLRQQGLEFERQRALLELEQAKLRLQQAELEQQRAELEKQKAPDPTPPQQISQGEQINSEAIFNLERGMFETTQQYFARLNQAAQKGDRRYQAGVAYLKNYNADNETLFVSLKWQAEWVKEYLGTYSKFGIVKIAPGDAEALWKAGKNKPLFFTAELAENSQNITGGVLVEGGKAWTISISPIPEMVTIPAGRFQMGGTGDNEKPIHWVSLKSFSMSRYEITFDEYDYFAEATGRSKPSDKNWGRGKRPVIHVSWYDATAYAEWLSQVTGEQYRLPTEAEWEYAARGGTDTDYWWGNDVGSNNANCSNSYCKDRFEYTAPVGSFAPNPFGLYDTAGNVWEWTCSEYEGKYSGKEQRCLSQNIASNESRLSLRGGSWNNDVARVRSADRFVRSPTDRTDYVGLRVARLP
jgi:formylglycine-generating enzyme required for sulfatase activity/uncharacterized caspase-like protein